MLDFSKGFQINYVDFDIHDEIKDKFFKFTNSYDVGMQRREYEDQKDILSQCNNFLKRF